MRITSKDSDAERRRGLQSAMVQTIVTVCVFGLFSNALLLSGPLYMLQVYDRVLTSKSLETLVGLTLITGFLLIIWGVLDFVRGRILARFGAWLQCELDQNLRNLMQGQERAEHTRDLDRWPLYIDRLQRPFVTPIGAAVADIIWVPIFLLALAFFHPWLCWLAVIGGLLLCAINRGGYWASQSSLRSGDILDRRAQRLAHELAIAPRAMARSAQTAAIFRTWAQERQAAAIDFLHASDQSAAFAGLAKTWRLVLQSAMLGLGAYLVLFDALTPGAMVAATVLLGRVMGPLDTVSSQWHVLGQARSAWQELRDLRHLQREPGNKTRPVPTGSGVSVLGLGLTSPIYGTALEDICFELKPGSVLGVIGGAGAGKTTLLKALMGEDLAGQNTRVGRISLGSTQWADPDVLPDLSHCGFVPQRPYFFDGSIAQNLTGFCEDPDFDHLQRFADRMQISTLIQSLPRGFESHIDDALPGLAEDVIYRAGLVAQLYRKPEILLLDDPFALQRPAQVQSLHDLFAQRAAAGQTTIFSTRFPVALEPCSHLLWLEAGRCRAFGAHDTVLPKFMSPRTGRLPSGRLGVVS